MNDYFVYADSLEPKTGNYDAWLEVDFVALEKRENENREAAGNFFLLFGASFLLFIAILSVL